MLSISLIGWWPLKAWLNGAVVTPGWRHYWTVQASPVLQPIIKINWRILFYLFTRIHQTERLRLFYCRKVHGTQLNELKLTSGECFVLEMIVDNLKTTPNMVTMFLDELESRFVVVRLGQQQCD